MGLGDLVPPGDGVTTKHNEDLADIRRALQSHRLLEGEHDTFSEWEEWVEQEDSRSLSPKQREWLQRALARSNEDRAPTAENLYSRGLVKAAAFAPLDSIPKALKPPGRT